MTPTDIAVAWSEWSIIAIDEQAFLGKQFQLREDLLGTEILHGWIGLTLNSVFSVEEYLKFNFSDAAQFVDNYTLQCGVLHDTTDEDMEPHWDEVSNLFRGKSMSYSEPE